jgi:DNA-binding LacI/PurR family transcriptional regulator
VDAGPILEISASALKAGLTLPRDLSFVAFDDLESPLKFAGPRVDFERLGYESVELLESKIVQQVLFPTLWHEGNSLVQAP